MTQADMKERILECAEKHPGKTPSYIAKALNVSKSAAYYHMTVAGYWPTAESSNGGRGNPFTIIEDARLYKMSIAGSNPYDIGRAIGRPESSVRMRLYYLASREGA